jgi:hypothetical protein
LYGVVIAGTRSPEADAMASAADLVIVFLAGGVEFLQSSKGAFKVEGLP